MGSLFENAVHSIRLGIEDYQNEDPRRALSAIRNFYDGLLLLAKEVLARNAPEASAEEILRDRYKPVPDGGGGIKYIPASKKSIDFSTIGERFKDFELKIDHGALEDLNRIRTDVAHYFSEKPRETMREAIAKAFPVVVDLFRLAEEEPVSVLGECWKVILEVREVYERERAACRATFDAVDWKFPSLAEARLHCPVCDSDLVIQDDPENDEVPSIQAHCRACGADIPAEKLVARALDDLFAGENYRAIKDGGEPITHNCPECGLETYLTNGDENGCAWCDFVLNDNCALCSGPLTPEDAAVHDPSMCSYCYHVIPKDD